MSEEEYEWYSKEEVDKIILGEKEKRLVSLRINRLKANQEEIMNVLDNHFIEYQRVSWYPDALIILNKKEADIEKLDIYKDGKIYLQSLSSMIPPLVLGAKPLESVLDMTSAPGGKTSEIAALQNNQVLITAVEKNKIRAERLKYNLEKLGVKKTTVVVKDARELDNNFKFDKILLDAPCSGSGTLRIIDGKIIDNFSFELIKKVENWQIELLRKAISLVNIGGIIVYSTCSILNRENEDIVKEFINEGLVEVLDIEEFNEDLFRNSTINGALKILPDKFYEGFFVVKLKRIK